MRSAPMMPSTTRTAADDVARGGGGLAMLNTGEIGDIGGCEGSVGVPISAGVARGIGCLGDGGVLLPTAGDTGTRGGGGGGDSGDGGGGCGRGAGALGGTHFVASCCGVVPAAHETTSSDAQVAVVGGVVVVGEPLTLGARAHIAAPGCGGAEGQLELVRVAAGTAAAGDTLTEQR
eukprot:4370702-Prymnesium_polylepis.1